MNIKLNWGTLEGWLRYVGLVSYSRFFMYCGTLSDLYECQAKFGDLAKITEATMSFWGVIM